MDDDPLIVCLPDDELAVRVVPLVDPAVASVVVWDGTLPAPAGATATAFYVPPYNSVRPTAAALAAMPGLDVIQLMSAGYDGWEQLRPAGVTLCNARGVHGVSTAELAVALLLASVRELRQSWSDQREHVWLQRSQNGLTSRPVLVLGAGDIAGRVAAALRPLGAEVTLVGQHAREGIRPVEELPDLLPLHRALVVTVPLTDATRGMVGARQMAALPDGSVVVNVARGAVVDTDALLAELTSGRLRAGLDVTDPEPLPADHPLWDAPNLILTPHVGGGTQDWPDRAARLIAEQLGRLTSQGDLLNVVLSGP